MIAGVLGTALRFLSWPAGPVFGKELRISSRRRRSYVLRSAYVLLLTAFVVLVWLAKVRDISGANAIARMPETGKVIIVTIAWVQFFALQLVAVVILSTAISEEVRARTLGVLMSTPVSAFQIVFGKLLSGLLQLLVLLAVSLPLLTLVRVFGGVPLDYVLATVCITFTACLFAGAVALLFSALFRRAYAGILLTLGTLGVLYVLVPMMVALAFTALGLDGFGGKKIEIMMIVLLHLSPLGAQLVNTFTILEPGNSPIAFFSWPLHCGIMVVLSSLVLLACTLLVRRASLRSALGGARPRPSAPTVPPLPGTAPPGPPSGTDGAAAGLPADRPQPPRGPEPLPTEPPSVAFIPPATRLADAVGPVGRRGGKIRHVKGSPVVWKELRTPLFRSRLWRLVALMVALAILGSLYALLGAAGSLDEDATHMFFVGLYIIVGVVSTAVISATSITAEKESRCWPLLLATPLSEAQILRGKAVGVLRRCWPAWVPLPLHLIAFVLLGYLHPVVLVHLFMVVLWLTVFLGGVGLYFSARFKRTTTAVVMNLVLAAVLWVVAPLLLQFVGEMTWTWEWDEVLLAANPVVQAGVLTEGASQRRGDMCGLSFDFDLTYWWPPDMGLSWTQTTVVLAILGTPYIIAGLVFAWLAKHRIRKNIFG